ncbi:MAG: DNA polymerase III subunit alpha [Bacteroidetes bacterium]|nr:DNA polymerase III subunit alpha [Bacteroidota bacterium]HET6244539.1 DNA polymerase III subunit alpha [Bacteroidia bacterium]
MILNAHSNYSLRYGVIPLEELVQWAIYNGYEAVAITDINNSSGILDFVKICIEKGIKPLVGMEFRNKDELLFIALARNNAGFKEINELMTNCNLAQIQLPSKPDFLNCYVIYPYGKIKPESLKEHEYLGVRPGQLNQLVHEKPAQQTKYVIQQPYTYKDYKGYEIHKKLRAIHNNILLSQVKPGQLAGTDEFIIPEKQLLKKYADYPHLIENTNRIIRDCNFSFDFKSGKNKKTYTGNAYDDKLLLEKLAYDGLKFRYGTQNKTAIERVNKELEIIQNLGFCAYFLITADIIRYSMQRGYYHVGRGSGANSVVAYCLRITDVCPIELDLYFERFLNPKRKSPPDFDIDYSWQERDDVIDYIFKRYGRKHTALLGAMSTFKDRSIIREMGKVYGLPKEDIDRLIKYPASPLNQNDICTDVLSHYSAIEDFPNMRTIHSCGILISEEPITCYTALDLPPKGFQTTQFDMHQAEDIGFEKLDILSQRGIGHIKDAAEIIFKNRGIKVDIHDIQKFKTDEKVRLQLKSGDTIGCFYIESPAMRGLLKKLKCEDYLTLVAASSIIRPGVAKSGMMKAYIQRFHDPAAIEYLHPVMKDQLRETFGVMVFQEDVLKVGHHFGGLDLADADVLRRMMSGKSRNKKHLEEITEKYFVHCKAMGYSPQLSKEVWRQIESFAGYSFSKAHSASYAVESYQSLYLKTYFPLEFMVAVINNFGGFYPTKIYINETKKAGGTLHLPCVNRSSYLTSLKGTDVFLGFIHIKSMEQTSANTIERERKNKGKYKDLEDFILRTNIGIESLRTLIRMNALRFTGQNKRQLLWEAYMLFDKEKTKQAASSIAMFEVAVPHWEIPELTVNKISDAYDELELLEFPVTLSAFDLLKSDFRGECKAKELLEHIGKTVRMVGNYVTYKGVRTIRGDLMAFGTFLDEQGNFFDTTHFPPSLKNYPFTGSGVYLILGRVVQEFGFPSIEVEKMARMGYVKNPISE